MFENIFTPETQMKRLFLLEDDLSLINGLSFAVKRSLRGRHGY